jgi:hypothetical protein
MTSAEYFEKHYVPSWKEDFLTSFLTLSLASLSVAGGSLITAATAETINLVADGYYDPTDQDHSDVTGKFLKSIWTALVISFVVWTMVVMYLVKLINLAREARRVAMEEIKEKIAEREAAFSGLFKA